MVKKLYLLWYNHPVGFCRVMTALIIPACFSTGYGFAYCNALLVVSLIINAGLTQHWEEEQK